MTISINDMDISLHPLDLTISQGISSQTCLGVIQAADDLLSSTRAGDMILGVPFLRNVYTVLAHDIPFANGSFDTESINNNETFQIRPRLGLINLTDPGVALDEFHTVRVLGQPLSSSGSHDSRPKHSTSGGASGLSVGLKVLLALVGVFSFALLLFAIRFLWQRRKWKRSPRMLDADSHSGAQDSSNSPDESALSGLEDSSKNHMRNPELDEYMSRKALHSTYTVDTMQTKVEPDNRDNGEEMLVDEFGLVYFGRPGKGKKGRNSATSSLFSSFPDQATMVGMGIGDPDGTRLSQRFGFTAFPLSSPGLPGIEESVRRRSNQSNGHTRIPSGINPAEPLLAPRSSVGWSDSYFPIVDALQREGVGQGWDEDPGTRDSMVGVGAHDRHVPFNAGICLTSPTTQTSSGGLPTPGMSRHSRLPSSFDHTVEDPLLPPSSSLEGGSVRTQSATASYSQELP